MHEEHQGGASGEAPWYGHEKPRVLGLERLESDGRKACGGSGGRAARMDRDTAAVVPVSRRAATVNVERVKVFRLWRWWCW